MADAVDVVVMLGREEAVAGRLWPHRRQGTESATFSYHPGYLARPDSYELDPQLPLVSGQQQTPARQALFGAFSDCAPDRWGRRLIERTERRRAQHAGRAERSFGEIDYLLGVRDDLRQGALRFRHADASTYLADERAGVPHLVDLPKLVAAAARVERDEADDEELEALLRGGSSLGGARPKAHVRRRDGRVAIAKFPSPVDDWEVMRWEAVALTLARSAGIAVPDWTVEPVDGKAVLVVDRFDREGDLRIGYVSAMTMLEATDGDGASYLDIADVIERHSSRATADLRELWRRMAFSVLISNTDDHLRNHGFLRTTTPAWTLSPAFDLNPDPRPGPRYLSTAIDYESRAARIDTLLSVAGLFRLDGGDAATVLDEVSRVTSDWRAAARMVGLDRAATERMAPAFEHTQAEAARKIAG